MRQAHIAFFSNETKAHTYATLAIAAALSKRGHRVTYATTEALAPEIIRVGAEAIIYQSLELYKHPPSENGDTRALDWNLLLELMIPFSITNSINLLSQLGDFYNQNPPDVVIYDPDAYAGRFLAKSKNIPAIQTSPYFAFYNQFYLQENCPWPISPGMENICQRLNQFFALAFPIEDLNIFTIPKIFQHNADSFDDRFLFSGPCILEPAEDIATGDKKPTILISRSASTLELKSDYEYFKTFIEALSESDFRVILSIGSYMDPAALGPLPNNIEVNQHAPQSKIIPNATLFIGSGGAVSTFEAIYYGIPVILVPQDVSHMEMAHRVTELGLGLMINKEQLTTAAIRDAVQHASTDQCLTENVLAMKKSIRDDRGPETFADKIEDYIELKA